MVTKSNTVDVQQTTNRSYELKQRKAAQEAEQIHKFNISMANRNSGKVLAEPGNKGLQSTRCEVFIFLVDDNDLQLKVLQEQFKSTKNFKKTKAFTSGRALFEYLKKCRFPKQSIFIVVMDYMLESSNAEESENGIEVLTELKEYDPNIEVIMLSSHTDVDISASATYFGAVSFIQKGNDAFGKILNNITWTIREQDKIRKQAEAKQFIRMAIFVFVGFLFLLFAIDFVTGILSPMKQGILGILPIPQ